VDTKVRGRIQLAWLPNPDHRGVVVPIEGTNAEVTEAAGDFLLSEEQLSSFKKTLHSSTLPYLEVLLRVPSVPGTPLTATVEAWRAYPGSDETSRRPQAQRPMRPKRA
jgi:hypothetical protein